jgi:hypothetical protein
MRYRRSWNTCGKVSGRQGDKFANCGFVVRRDEMVPYFPKGKLVLICKKLYTNDFDPNGS